MGVYIKGMEMPTSCFDCNFCVEAYEGAGVYSCVVSDKCVCRGAGRHDDCPLVPVPPHGDLIDKDELIENCMKEDGFLAELLFRKVSNAPTIIPPEEE